MFSCADSPLPIGAATRMKRVSSTGTAVNNDPCARTEELATIANPPAVRAEARAAEKKRTIR